MTSKLLLRSLKEKLAGKRGVEETLEKLTCEVYYFPWPNNHVFCCKKNDLCDCPRPMGRCATPDELKKAEKEAEDDDEKENKEDDDDFDFSGYDYDSLFRNNLKKKRVLKALRKRLSV